MYFLLITSVLLSTHFEAANVQRQPNECELKCHNRYSAIEREQLCRGTHKGNLIGPALCAAEAKAKLNLKFDVVLQLCKGASSIAPITCYHSLPSSERGKYGTQLCARTTSDLSSRCWREMSSFSGSNRLKDSDMLDFCTTVEDWAPIICVKSAVSSSLSTAALALLPCKNATLDAKGSTLSSTCISHIKKQVSTSKGFSATDIINFCAGVSTNGTLDCFDASVSSASSPTSLSMLERSRLCSDAPGRGPVDCALEAMRLDLKLRGEALISLCSLASGVGPALCFRDSKGIGGSDDSRTTLCNSATSSGPAHCFRRAQPVFRQDEMRLQMLCAGAESDDPATCAYGAPHYLSPDEKLHLCQDAAPSRGQEPLKCLQLIEGPSHHFSKAPSKGLGYVYNTLTLRSDQISRELLIAMCSFSSSSSPLIAAECLKTTSFSLDHDDAVRMCTNATSTESSRHMTVCTRMLPRDWSSSEASLLCRAVTSQSDAEGVVKCALDSTQKLRLSKVLAAELCHLDTRKNHVLSCALAAVPYPGPSTGVDSTQGLPSSILIDVCAGAVISEPGVCLSKAFGHAHLSFQAGAVQLLCKAKASMSKLGCLGTLRKQHITMADVDECVGEERVVAGVKITQFISEEGKQQATAGRRFALKMLLFDQWSQRLEFDSKEEEVTLSASINDNNPQGAVLWGTRSNVTHKGVLELNHLMISQPGKVSFKISKGGESIAVFSLTVNDDPSTRNAASCVAYFKRLNSPFDSKETDWTSYFPRTKGFLPSSQFFHVTPCMDTLSKWHVGVYPTPSGAIWFDFRSGIDSIWTGNNLPRLEMTFEQRLDLNPALPYKMKDVRRAYYRKSLQWHPDRWAGMPIYSLVVQGAFELINEAYEGLMKNYDKSDGRKKDL